MRFNEMKSQMSGLPEGFSGAKTDWADVKEPFQIRKVCMMVRPQMTEAGDMAQNPVTGEVYYDRNLAFAIETVGGKELVVYTNSPKLIPVFRQQITEDRKPDYVNRYGTDVYILDPPEGMLRFTTAKHKYGKIGEKDVAYLEEAELLE